jgi:hypothetical protein
MTLFIVLLFVIYFGVAIFTTKRYFLRRHSVLFRQGDRGTVQAIVVGLLWPAMLWSETTRNPPECDHHHHILQRARIREEIEQVERYRRRR